MITLAGALAFIMILLLMVDILWDLSKSSLCFELGSFLVY